jgi:hypothetical protein
MGRICISIFAALFALSGPAAGKNWPLIRPLKEKHVFRDAGSDGADAPLFTFILDTLGTPVYKVECHNGNYPDDSEINFSGDFQCALFAVKGRNLTSSDLLAGAKDDKNRARMHSAQLRGDCLQYPEYGAERHFRVRGMVVTLRFSDVKWSAGRLAGFTLTLEAAPDESAVSAVSESIAGPEPPAACDP